MDNGAYLFWGALTAFGNVTVLDSEHTPTDVVNTTREHAEAWEDKNSSIVGMLVSQVSGLTRAHLDQVSTTRPVIIFGYDLYHAWANTYALEHAGILYRKKINKTKQNKQNNIN